ncbi:MAG: DUF2264 domain-containing protein [Rikenellaceae bacterium]|nr:DUF2264 domain-containing protein [Rikenellaceae bacterium]
MPSKGNNIDESSNIFILKNPDYQLSPCTGMARSHWIDAAQYILDGAFSYIQDLDDPMKFPKQFDKTYPQNEQQVPTEKLEGLCRTLFVAAPLLRENPDLVLNNIKVADYYRHQILNLINPDSPSFIKHRTGGTNQILVEFGALAISLSVIPDILWEPLTQNQKDNLAATMLSYGDGPTVHSNWKFFNIFVLSFFKDQGYTVNEELLLKYVDEALDFYRGDGWYNDNPAYDYYSMWAFQMYGPMWAQMYGNKYHPDRAEKFMDNLRDLADNYPYMFNRDGKMNMWGRSISYRYASIIPLPLLGYFNDPNINYGWMRKISSATILQFLQHPEFMEDRVPTLGFYGPFAPAVQIYSCRGSVYWGGKVFFALLLLPEDNIFWTAVENDGAWESELHSGDVYNKFQTGSNLLITNYPNSGSSEMRSWCHETVAKDWQKFRSSENYNKLSYNTDFPWMADGEDGEVSMNYAVKNKKGEWEVLRLYTFKSFENGIYSRQAVLETEPDMKFQLNDIPLPDGILRVDKITTPFGADIRLGHYSLPELKQPITEKTRKAGNYDAYTINNGEYELAMIPVYGWNSMELVSTEGLHPVSDHSSVINTKDRIETEKIYITLELWKKGGKPFMSKELNQIKNIKISEDTSQVEVVFRDNSVKTIRFE